MAKAFGFNEESARRIASTVRAVEAQPGNPRHYRGSIRSENRPVVEGELATNLVAGGTATLNVHRGSDGTVSDSGDTVTVKDRIGFDGTIGDWVIAIRMNDEWRVISLDPSTTADKTCFNVVTDVFCSGGSLVECTRQICLPDSDVGAEDCGAGDSGTTGTGGTGTVSGGSCCVNPLPSTLTMTVTNDANCACIAGETTTLNWTGSGWFGTDTYASCAGGMDVIANFTCTGSTFSAWRMTLEFGGSCGQYKELSPTGGACDPLSIEFQTDLAPICCNQSILVPTVTFTVTE